MLHLQCQVNSVSLSLSLRLPLPLSPAVIDEENITKNIT